MKNNRLLYLLIVILTIWCVVLTSSVMKNNDSEDKSQVVNSISVDGFSTDFTKVVDKNKSSIVTINASATISTGFVYKQIENDIYIVTSYHGLTNATNYSVIFASGYSVNGELIDKNIYADIAVIKIVSPFNIDSLTLADASILSAGEFVISIGTSKNIEYDQTVEMGMISSGVRTIENDIDVGDENIRYYLDCIQFSSKLKQGFSGSPLINMNGDVIGMCTMSLDNDLCFAITANEIQIIADRIIAGEDDLKYQLGISGTYIKDMPLFERSNLNLSVEVLNGLYINRILDNSILNSAGIKTGDVLLSINNVTLNNFKDYLDVVYTKTDSLSFELLREGEVVSTKVVIND